MYFQNEPKEGIICRKCWCHIEIFHSFYTRIESIHSVSFRQETVFVDTLLNMKYECEDEEMQNGANANETIANDSYESDTTDSDFFTKFEKNSIDEISKYEKRNEANSISIVNKQNNNGKISSMSATMVKVNLKCSYSNCKNKFNTQDELNKHLSDTHGHKMCPLCMAVSDIKNLNSHLMAKHSDFTSVLCECGTEFDNKFTFSYHYQKYHENGEPLPAKNTNKTNLNRAPTTSRTTANTSRNVHKKIATTTSGFGCRYLDCDQDFSNQEQLSEHLSDDHGHRLCPLCMTISDEKNLVSHLTTKHVEFSTALCECGALFENKFTFLYHYQKFHENKECVCDICGAT